MKTSASVLAAAVALLGIPALAADLETGLYAKPAQLFAVEGGRRLNLVCTGSGSPTVILEAGAGGYSTAWRRVQPGIASFTRVCAYDRAGYGFSDPIDRPSTAANTVDDLHTALGKAGIGSPIILVGHSAGGLYASLYADLHLSDVAGLVFLDPLLAGQGQLYGQFLSADDIDRRNKALADDKARRRNCIGFVKAGVLKAHEGECVRAPTGLSPELAQVFGRHMLEAKTYEASLSEDEALYGDDAFRTPCEDDREEQAAARSYGGMPLLVLIGGNNDRGPPEAAWRASIDRLAARSTKGRVTVVPNSGHNIMLDRPEAVIAAVKEVWAAAKTRVG